MWLGSAPAGRLPRVAEPGLAKMEAARAGSACRNCLPRSPSESANQGGARWLGMCRADCPCCGLRAASLQAKTLRVEDGQAQAVGQLLLGPVRRQQQRVEARVAGGQPVAVGAIALRVGWGWQHAKW